MPFLRCSNGKDGIGAVADDGGLELAGGFPPGTESAWRAIVAKVLKGADFERRLVGRTRDGLRIEPLYMDAPASPAGRPGERPFVRGATAAGSVAGGWDVRQQHAHPDPAMANKAILEDLERGVTSIQLAIAEDADAERGVLAHDLASLETALASVYVDLAPIALQAGRRGLEAAAQLLAVLERRYADPASTRAELGLDPLGLAAAGAALDPAAMLEGAIELTRHVAGTWPQVGVMLADGRPYHAAGASEAQELACVVATGIAYLRALTDAGLAPAEAAARISFSLATDADFFLSLAKLRTLRRLWGRVLEVADAEAAMRRFRLHAETATRMLTGRDPHVNMLRGTVATFAAAAGGAQAITVLPFDHVLGLPDAFSRRIARNTQLVLLEESNLHRVADPAGGAWYVESLTEQLATAAWSIVQTIERHGGMAAALEAGMPQETIGATWAARAKDLATRREAVTGVSEFPDLHERPRAPAKPDSAALRARLQEGAARDGRRPGSFAELLKLARAGAVLPGPEPVASGVRPLAARRLAEAFEALRDRSDAILARTGSRPRIFLCNLGRLAEFGARATFARNLFEAGGIEAVMSEPLASLEDVGHAFKASGASVAALCSSDENYASMGEGAARALKHAHSRQTYLMGRPDAEAQERFKAAGIDAFVHMGADVLATLQGVHAILAGEANA